MHVPQNNPDFKRVDYGADGRNLDVPSRPPRAPTPIDSVKKAKVIINETILVAQVVEKPKSTDWKRVLLSENIEYSQSNDNSTNASNSISRQNKQPGQMNSQ